MVKESLTSVFPFYKNDGVSIVNLTQTQEETRKLLLEKIASKELLLVKNTCLCSNLHENQDVIVSEKDRYGLPIKTLCCSKCGLLRCDKVFDEKSNELFYKQYYTSLYRGTTTETISKTGNVNNACPVLGKL